MLIRIEDNWLKVESVETFAALPILNLEDGTELYVAESTETAGAAAKEYHKDLAENDAAEFSALVGAESLIAWGLGQWGGPGANQYRSLEEWLDGVAEEPEVFFGSQDSTDIDVDDFSEALQTELGFDPGVVYLHNGSLPNDFDRVVVNLFGGDVQGVFADKPNNLKVTVIDWDYVPVDDREKIPHLQEIDAAKVDGQPTSTGKHANCTIQTVHPLGNMSNSLKEAVAKAR